MNKNVIIDQRFEGPIGSANGGYVAGYVAKHIDGPVEVTLRQKIPLGVSLLLQKTEQNEVFLRQEGQILVEAKSTEFEIDVPASPPFEMAKKAEEKSPSWNQNPFSCCFGCGVKREEGDGLRIFAGPVEGKDLVAATWIPQEDLVDDQGNVELEYIATTLDCSGGFAFSISGYHPEITGRLAIQTKKPIKAHEKCVIIGWQIEVQGRKLFAGTALFSENQELAAYAKATWFQPANFS